MTPPVPVSPDARLDELEARIRRLEEALFHAGSSASALPETDEPAAEHFGPPLRQRAARASPLILDVLAQTGWSVLTLAGAFLIRALTDRGAVATDPGVAFGLAYALGIILLADRASVRGNRLMGAFLGSTGAFIANAIVAETTTRFAIFAPSSGMAILAVATAIALAVGRRHDLPALDWTATLAASATAVYVALLNGAPAPSGLFLLLLATATSWLGAAHWSWRLLALPPTLGAAALSVWATSVALSGGTAARGGGVALALPLALGLPLLWCGGVFLRALVHRPRVGGIAVLQTILAIAVGVGGALRLEAARGPRAAMHAATTLALGAGCYLFAFLREKAPEARSSRLYFAWLGLALTVIGSGVLLPAPVPALAWGLACLAAAVGSRRFEPAILQPHATIFAAAAATASGLLWTSVRNFTVRPAALAAPSGAALAALAALTVAATLLLCERPAAGALPAFLTTLFAALGIGALAVLLLDRPAAAVLDAPLPALRTMVVSLSAYALAFLWRSTGRRELRTLAYLALVAGGIKLLLEDLPQGTPMTLFVAFVFYGGALLLVPRLMRGGGARAVPAAPRTPA